MSPADTIFALSSGAPPAAIAVVRVSGPAAHSALMALTGRTPQPRRATALTLRDAEGGELDRALVLWLPGPSTATGEDCVELHLHGGRAVVGAVETRLATLPGLRRAEAGEFTRRAFANGRIDLAEAEGLADLLSAETELQRRSALAMAGGALSQAVGAWRDRVLVASAQVEAVLDFSDEDDVAEMPNGLSHHLSDLIGDLQAWLDAPRAEPLREGYRVVLAGPPNAGKSSLFNALIGTEAAITAPTPGTTRDLVERSISFEGVPFTLVDTAGLRDGEIDDVEAVGIVRARDAVAKADLTLWLGPEGRGPPGAWEVAGKSDLGVSKTTGHAVSAQTGYGITQLVQALIAHARGRLPKPGQAALNARQHGLLSQACHALREALGERDLLLLAEHLRAARMAFDRLTGRAGTEDMLDALFGRFCIGK